MTVLKPFALRRALHALHTLEPCLWVGLIPARIGIIVLALIGMTLLVACRQDVTASPSPTGETRAALTSTATLAPTSIPVTTLPPTPIPVATSAPAPTPTATLAPTPTFSGATSTATPPATVLSAATERHLRLFTQLWETVRDSYVYTDFNGLDWDDVYRRYRDRVEAGMADEGFYQAMREMIDELGDGHSAFHSPEEVAEDDERLSGQFVYVGIGIYVTTLWDKGYAVLLDVFPDSPAEQAGLMRHHRVLAIDGVPVVDEGGEDRLHLLEGSPGSEVRLTVQTPGQEPRQMVVLREKIQAQLRVEAHRLPGTDIAYLLIPTFWDETVADRVRQAVEILMAEGDLKGVILDMRINGGGVITTLQDTLSIFTGGELGVFVSREDERPLFIESNPIGNSLDVPLVVLVGRETASFGEIFCGVLQENGRAWLVGRTTDGNVEILSALDFEDGSRAWIASETFRPPSGTDWEETGIVPDLEIPLDWDEFTAEDDQQLQAAIDWLIEITQE